MTVRPADRHSDRVESKLPTPAEFQGLRQDKGDDTHTPGVVRTAGARRISQAQLAVIRRGLSSRDQTVLESLRAFRFLRISQLQRLVFTDHQSPASASRVARRVMARLADAGLAFRLERRIGGIRAGSAGYIYALAPLGHRLLGEPGRKRLHEPSLVHLEHTLAISEIASQLIAAERHSAFSISDLQLEPQCWRPIGSETLKPDMHIRLSTPSHELSWFIEIDRDTESSRVIESKCRRYVQLWRSGSEQQQHGVFPRVLWISPSPQRSAVLARSAELISGPAGLFAYREASGALSAITDGEAE